jgi:hypothetical protein
MGAHSRQDKKKPKPLGKNPPNTALDGKKTIVQVIAGGYMQFLTKAQGMPQNIQDAIMKEIQTFIWGENKKAPIVKETLYTERQDGRIELLDIQFRNEAVNIMWLKEYMNTYPTRPTWAYITDILIHESAPINIPNKARITPFMQTWQPPTKGKRAEMLDKNTIQLLKMAKKFGLQFAPRRMTHQLKKQLPAWFHIGEL